jgi:flavin reductase (DIM6/NTAB) family NADH-FMN oxidoreductase RutF
VMQVAVTPKLVAVAVERTSVTRELITEGGGFSVSVLARADRAVVRRFVKPVSAVETDAAGIAVALQGEPVHEVVGGLPCLVSAVSWLSCRVRHTGEWTDVGGKPASHVLFVGEVVDVGHREPTDGPGEEPEILRMEDTRMNYGG